MIPKRTTTEVTNALGVAATIFLSATSKNPVPSATLTPIIIVNTVPKAKKPVKFPTIDVTIYTIPSLVSKLNGVTVISSIALVALL